MKKLKENLNVKIIIYIILSFIVSLAVMKVRIISIPSSDKLTSRIIDIITISSIFAGFSFTSLSVLLGLASDKFIEKLEETDIMENKVDKIIDSLIFLTISIIISLFFILDINTSPIFIYAKMIERWEFIMTKLKEFFYLFVIVTFSGGVILFAFSIYDLFFLIKRVYQFNSSKKNSSKKKVDNMKKSLENNKKMMENPNFDE